MPAPPPPELRAVAAWGRSPRTRTSFCIRVAAASCETSASPSRSSRRPASVPARPKTVPSTPSAAWPSIPSMPPSRSSTTVASTPSARWTTCGSSPRRRSVTRCLWRKRLSAADGAQGDAGHPVLLRRVVGSVGHEPVLGVLAPGVDLEARTLDRLAVVVALHRTADAGGPQRRVAGHALGELLGRDDVGQRQAPSRPQGPCGCREHGGLVGREVDDAVRDHAVEAGVLDHRLLDVPLAELDVV